MNGDDIKWKALILIVANLIFSDFSDSAPKNLTDVPLSLVLPPEDIEGCQPYKTSLGGAIAFIRRGTCTFVQKVCHPT
jgi:hypothetical protein